MADSTLIWDHHRLQIWRPQAAGAQLLKEAAVEDIAGLLALLDATADALQITRLRLYIDGPELDHHLERVPSIAPKLQQQLLQQRQAKLYGEEERAWVASDMALGKVGNQQFYLVSSLPNAISSALVAWTLRNGIYLEGIFSLPYALACLDSSPSPDPQGRIHYRALGEAGYLMARNGAGKLLFFSRVHSGQADSEALQMGARRLGLFVEQEFGLNPLLEDAPSVAGEAAAATVGQLAQTKAAVKLSLVTRAERNRQRNRRLRHRGFVIACLALVLTALQTMEQQAYKEQLRLQISEHAFSQQQTTAAINAAQRAILQSQHYHNVINFSEGRESIDAEARVPAPLLVLMNMVAATLPESVEIDQFLAELEAMEATARFHLSGRPISADTDLAQQLEQMAERLEKQGLAIGALDTKFKRNSRFSRQRGSIREFTLDFTIRARSTSDS
jgi:hypothetical protein